MNQRQQSLEHLEPRQHLDGQPSVLLPALPTPSIAIVTAPTIAGPEQPKGDPAEAQPAKEQVLVLNNPSGFLLSHADLKDQLRQMAESATAPQPKPGDQGAIQLPSKEDLVYTDKPATTPRPQTPVRPIDRAPELVEINLPATHSATINAVHPTAFQWKTAITPADPPSVIPTVPKTPVVTDAGAETIHADPLDRSTHSLKERTRPAIEISEHSNTALAVPFLASKWRTILQRFINPSNDLSIQDSPFVKSAALRPEQSGASLQSGIQTRASALALALPRWVRPLLLVILPAPVLLMLFLHQDSPVGRLLVGMTALVIAMVGGWWWQHSLIARRRNVIAGMLMVTGMTITGAILWNHSYVDYSKSMKVRKEVFRRTLQKYYTPFYGRPTSPTALSAALVAVTAAAGVAMVLRAKLDVPMTRRRMAIILLLQAAAIGTFAQSEGMPRLLGHSPQLEPFRRDASQFTGPAELLADYVIKMPKLSWFGQHYPPGSAMLFLLERLLHIAPLGSWAIGLSVVTSTLFVYLAVRELTPRHTVHNLATIAFAAASGPLIYSSLSTTPMVLLPGAIAMWCFFRALRNGSVLSAIGIGLSMVAFALLSFSAVFFAMVLGLFLVATVALRLQNWRKAVKMAVFSGVAAVGIMGVLRVGFGFDMMKCAAIGVKVHHEQAATNGFDSAPSFFMRSSGNFLAFGLANLPLIAIVTTGAILMRRSAFKAPCDLLLPATLMAILLAAGSGKFYLETERIWILFIPPLVIAAALEMARHDDFRGRWDARVILVAMIVFAAVQEVGFTHYWD